MTLQLSIAPEEADAILFATIDTTTRKVTALQIAPTDLPTAFISLNALLGTLEAHLQLQHLNTSAK
jgi:hypothetical protein